MNQSWERHWGMDYDKEGKREFLSPIFRDLDAQGKIGEVVLDVGSGHNSVAKYLPGTHKLIALDIAGQEIVTEYHRQIKFDVNKIEDKSRMSFKKSLVRTARFLGIDLRQETNREQIDSMIFSEILNYVDYQLILHALAEYLKPGGRFIIINKPGRGFRKLHAEQELKSNSELYGFLEQEGFVIEHKSFPWGVLEGEEDWEFIILIARKKTREESAANE